MAEGETTLRDTLTTLMDKAEAGEPLEVTPETPPATPAAETPQPGAAAGKPEAAGRTAGRARDDKGRLLPGKAEEKKGEAPPAAAGQAPPEPQPKPKIQRPSSWKKDYWGHWDKLSSGAQLTAEEAEAVAKYIVDREGDFAKGVSTYKTEAERAKPLLDAIAPHQELLKQYGVDPAKQIDRYFGIHRSLAFGTPEQKLSTLYTIARDYQIPVEQLFVRGQDGQIYWNQNLQQAQAQPPQQAQRPAMDVERIVEEKLIEREVNRDVAGFSVAKDAGGNPLHPHYEQVRETMAQLLDAGLADDLEGAYAAALRHPRHSEIWDELQKQQAESKRQEEAKKQAEVVARAKRNAISVKGSTPAAPSPDAKKGSVRSSIESAMDEVLGGRV